MGLLCYQWQMVNKMLKKKLEKYAHLIAFSGANIQENQNVVIRASVESVEFVRMLVKACYEAKARKVIVDWSDPYITRTHFENQSEETLCDVKDYYIAEQKDIYESGSCFISLTSPIPEIMKGVDSKKMMARNIAYSKKMQEFRRYTAANLTQWCVAAVSNPIWAKKVFPELNEQEANVKLWDSILTTCHVLEDNDPIVAWQEHNEAFARRIETLNNFNFKELHFTNSKGTDLHVCLAPNHIWEGGYCETQEKRIVFNPNMPTEEIFTMPYRNHVNGTVVTTKPLDYQGNIIEEFTLRFENGRVVEYSAKNNEDSLKALVEFDEGSHYIGEVALVPYHSPISELNVLFYNTLFDENASCHLALGSAYPTTVKNGENMSKEELLEAGANDSLLHVDFMFGSSDMNVKGICFDGKEVDVFVNGDFVI